MTDRETYEYICVKCDYQTNIKQHWDKHMRTFKHTQTASNDKSEHKCENCDYTTCNKQHWDKHLKTEKHKRTLGVKHECCVCEYYTYNRREWNKHLTSSEHLRHTIQPKCIEPVITVDMFQNLMKGYTDLQKTICKIMDQNSNAMTTTIECNQKMIECSNKLSECAEKLVNQPTNVSYTQNNSFNINMFLNETCKNAKNMTEFIDSIVITHEDLENNGSLGFVGGMIKIFTDNLNKLDITERPLHCTDLKRETIYIKDDGIWSKENSEEKINRGIQRISNRNVQELLKWKRSNPDYADINSEFSDLCHKIHCTLMAGDERVVLFPRVAKGIAKFVLLDKQQFMN